MKTTQLIAAMLVALAGPGAFAQPVFTHQPANSSVSLGATAQFTVYASSPNPPITYQWWFNAAALDTNANPSAAKNLLSLTNVTPAAAGPYFAVASDATGSATSKVATLTVDPTFTKITTGPVVTDKGLSGWSSWGDYDNDGYVDLLVQRVNGKTALYHNNRDGTFSTVTNSAMPIIGTSFYGSVAWADYDNDGFLDASLSIWGSSTIFCHNNGDGTFQRRFGLSDDVWSVAWGDYDKDGFLDLFVGSSDSASSLYHNNRDGTFTKMTTKTVGDIVERRAWSSGASWADYDDDGLLELFVGSNGGPSPNALYHLLPSGQFTLLKTNVVTSGDDLSGAWGDYDNDGLLDFAGANWSKKSVDLYHNLGQGNFKKVTLLPAAGTYTFNSVSWADYDNDGFLDLFVTAPGGMNRMFHNNGDGTFATASLGSLTGEPPLTDYGSYKGLWMDYDNDGFPDLFVVNGNDALVGQTVNFLYHNNGNSNAWLTVRLVGTVSNRSGVGAKVRAQAHYAGESRWQRRDISAGDAWNGNQFYAQFGLGDAKTVATLRIEWPSGIAEEFYNVAPRQILTMVEPSLKGAFGTDGSFHLQMSGNTNRTYQISTSADLVNWTALTNSPGPGPGVTVEVSDPAAGQSQRFYRLEAP